MIRIARAAEAALAEARPGTFGRRIARYRLPAWITAMSPREATC